MKTLLEQHWPLNITIDQSTSLNKQFYQDVLSVRNDPYNYNDLTKLMHKFDRYSDHYRLSINGKVTGSLSITQARMGKMDCQEYVPKCLLDNFHDSISSACKFRVIKNEVKQIEKRSMLALPKKVIQCAFTDQLSKGTRLDIINASVAFSRYYRQIGYVEIENSLFIHPTLGTKSVIMYLPADPSRQSIGQELFSSIDNQLPLKNVQRVLTRKPFFLSRTAA